MVKVLVIAVILSAAIFMTSVAEVIYPSDSTRTVFTEIGEDLTQMAGDFGNIGDKLYQEHTLYYIAGAAGGTLILMQADERLRSLALRNTSGIADTYFNYSNEYGNLITAAGITGGIYAMGLILDNKEWRTTGRYLGESLLLSGVLVTGMKSVFGRSRPYRNVGAYNFEWFETSNDDLALPSGHSAIAFTVSTVLSMRINRWWASSLLYAASLSTSLARMYKDQHWASDVVLGAGIGIFSGWIVCSANETPDEKPALGLIIMPNLTGFSVSCRF